MEPTPIPPPDDPTALPVELTSDIVPLELVEPAVELVRVDGPMSWREWAFSCKEFIWVHASFLNWRGAMFVVFWGIFIQSNWRGCDSANRLKRIEDQQLKLNASIIELQQRQK